MADNCFDASFAPRMFFPDYEDCSDAIQQISDHVTHEKHPCTFRRGRRVKFQLPWVARHGTCVVSLDVPNDDDWDIFAPWVAYASAVALARTCVQGESRLGGKIKIGPRELVTLMVFGRERSSIENGDDFEELLLNNSTSREAALAPSVPTTTKVFNDTEKNALQTVSDSDVRSSVSQPLQANKTSIPNSTSTRTNGSSNKGDDRLSEVIECYDPPAERERLYPIRISDCKQATRHIVGHRKRIDPYVFSRRVVEDPFYYRMPAKFTYGSCAVVLDMENDHDVSTVTIGWVENSALVLAHKCSGEELPYFRYGGRTTVGGGSDNDPIKINVYGILPRSSGREPVLSLSQIQNHSSVVDQ